VPRKQSPTLTEAELRLMDLLWLNGPGTVQQVQNWLPDHQPLAYNSVLTTIRVLERKGYVRHAKDGRAHVYEPLVKREEATRSEISHLLNRFFGNSRELLMLNMLEDETLDADELKKLRDLIDEKTPVGTPREGKNR
jgi:predicted transcriptional regulator